LIKALEECCALLGPDREVCVAREISKMYEEFQRGKASDVLAHYQAKPPKGEIVLLIKGVEEAPKKKASKYAKNEAD
jgi:16S rRNA (cytidine1402-2'-O)-methyltransferase